MNFTELISEIGGKYSLRTSHIASNNEFLDIFLVDGHMTDFDPEVLYIGHCAQLEGCSSFPENLLYWGMPSKNAAWSHTNCAKIEEKDFPSIFNAVKKELSRSLHSENDYVDMLKMILHGKSLSAILDIAREKTQNPFVALDISGKILAYSTPFDVSDPLWIQSVANGYCSYEFMKHIEKIRNKRSTPRNSEPFVSVCEENRMVYLCSKIMVRNNLRGYVFMLVNRTQIDKKSRELISQISRAAGDMDTHSQDNYDLRTGLYHEIMSDMLAGIHPNHARVRIKVSELEFPERMCVLIVRPSYYRGESFIKPVLQDELIKIFDNPPLLIYHGSAVLISAMDESHQIGLQALQALREFAQKEHLQIGISNEFTQPSRFAYFYAQAETALHFSPMANSDGPFFCYKDCAFFDLLHSLPNDLRLRRFCHPALEILREYDQKSGSALYQTLKIYTQTGFNQRRAAEIMFLHRNTMNYRLHRIEEITGIDLKNIDNLFLLLYSYKLDDYEENNM